MIAFQSYEEKQRIGLQISFFLFDDNIDRYVRTTNNNNTSN